MERKFVTPVLALYYVLAFSMVFCFSACGRPHSSGLDAWENEEAFKRSAAVIENPAEVGYGEGRIGEEKYEEVGSVIRRSLSGPGSSPPQCTYKCRGCYPCKPVHVPIQPGIAKTSEYYPEAWRCKCGSKLYMP